jgi:winged helix DNA-binding protein
VAGEVLRRRALNRALLERQMLLRRVPSPEWFESGGAGGPSRTGEPTRAGEPAGPVRLGGAGDRVVAAVERLVGLQAQAPFPPYYGLWSRLDGFRPEELAELIVSRRVVRIALMRGTIHLVSAADCLTLRPLMQPVLERALATTFTRRLAGVDLAELARAGRDLAETEPRTFAELGALLTERWPDHPPDALAQGVRGLVPLVQIPPRAVWGKAGQARHTTAEAWLAPPDQPTPPVHPGQPVHSGQPDHPGRSGQPVHPGQPDPVAEDAPSTTLENLVVRYLAAFGPASVKDIQAWSGLTRLREVVDRLRPGLRGFRDENGTELLDLPDAPRPDPQVPAPVRLVAEFDNLILSHADRSRVMDDEARARIFTPNGLFPGTVLIDGFVRGTWRITRSASAVTLSIEPYGKISSSDRDQASAEAAHLLEFAAPDTRQDIRFEAPPR